MDHLVLHALVISKTWQLNPLVAPYNHNIQHLVDTATGIWSFHFFLNRVIRAILNHRTAILCLSFFFFLVCVWCVDSVACTTRASDKLFAIITQLKAYRDLLTKRIMIDEWLGIFLS